MEALLLVLVMLVLWVVGIIVGLLVYFLPTVIAMRVQHRNAVPIFVVNLFFGWTLLGWVGALVWSLMEEGRRKG